MYKSYISQKSQISVWGEKVTSKKKTLLEIIEEEKEEQIQDQRESIEKIEEKKKAEEKRKYEERMAEKAEEKRKYEAMMSEEEFKSSPKNGCWKLYIPANYNVPAREVPREVNARALKFAQQMLTNVGEYVIVTNTIEEFKTVFFDLYEKRVKMFYEYEQGGFKWWTEFKNKTEFKGPADYYGCIQEWVNWEMVTYKSKLLEYCPKDIRPPWYYPFWVFAKNITWENVLGALDSKNETFQNVLLEICTCYTKSTVVAIPRYSDVTATLIWHVKLPYFGVNFSEKVYSKTR